jgi:TolB-like protein/Tfp pilus assembly protein PilF
LVTEPFHAVFLSYASQDVEAAQKICEALRAAGIEVFFDQSELRGGDAWDQKIRHEIHDCALFIPIVSRYTQERLEGYYRREWKLAIDRTHDMAEQKPFLVPVVVDGTRDQEAFVPDAFRAVQWTRLPSGETPPAFVERIKRLLSPELPRLSGVSGAAPMREWSSSPSWSKPLLLAMAAVIVFGALAYLWIPKHLTPSAAAFVPPPHSIAVLPFVNMSGDKEQEYFSDGLTEELLNSLAEINELQVAARTSAFSFKGKDTDIGTIARKLNVGAVLEGSVRRSGNTVRVTTQLINAVTGFHLWSHTYDRDLGDVLKLETEIASDVSSALKVSLLGDVETKIELGGTHNPGAFDAYLRARRLSRSATGVGDVLKAIAGFTEAIRLDPTFALAFAWRSLNYSNLSGEASAGITPQEILERQEADAREAIRLAPEMTEGYDALGRAALRALDFTQAREAFERALALAPGNTATLVMSSYFLGDMGQFDAAISAARRAVTLDPLNVNSHFALGVALYSARRYREAITPFADASSLLPESPDPHAFAGRAHYMLGDLESAKSSCEHDPEYPLNQWCLAMVYDKLGRRRTDAEGELAKMKSALGDTAAYQYAAVYAQWGDRAKALDWLDTAMRLRDGGLTELKTDPLLDPLRQEPRFQAMLRKLKFPD